MNRYCTSPRSIQTGAALVVSLMLLVVMTLIGITAMRTTVLEEKMSGNARDSVVAMQAAEAVLLDGEDYLQNTINSLAVAFDGSQLGLYQQGTYPNIFLDATWTNSIPIRTTYTGGVTSQPRFIIELTGETGTPDDGLEIESYDSIAALGTPYAFRVTARGTGGTDSAVVLLQSNYVRTF